MENRRKLHDNGLVLIVFGIAHLFLFIATMVKSIIDGSLKEGLANVDADILLAVKIVLGVVFALMVLLIAADVLLGVKALKVSKKPDASKGYIVIAKIFMILSCISVFAYAATLFGNSGSVLDASLNLASATLSVAVYLMFVTSADAVRKDFLNGTK